MDPNKTHEEMMALAKRLLKSPEQYEKDGWSAMDEDALGLAERVEALDEWLRGGGFLPKAWERDDAGS